MALKQPSSMDECVYFTRRNIDVESGKAMVWVLREICPKCKKGIMGKPRDSKGKVSIRAKEYVCPECKYTVEKGEYEDTLTANIMYTCQKCKFSGETQIPFKRKKVMGVDALKFKCQKCGFDIIVTKKMKKLKDKKKGEEDVDE